MHTRPALSCMCKGIAGLIRACKHVRTATCIQWLHHSHNRLRFARRNSADKHDRSTKHNRLRCTNSNRRFTFFINIQITPLVLSLLASNETLKKNLVIIVPSVKFDASTHCLEWWCERAHHITIRSVRLYSMNGGVRVDITLQ